MTHLLDPTTVEDDVKFQYSKKLSYYRKSWRSILSIKAFKCTFTWKWKLGDREMFAPGVTVPVVMRLQVTSDQVTGAGEQGVESRRAGSGEEE